jgi:hypothetical protein
VAVNFAVDFSTNQPPAISFTATGSQGWVVTPTNLVLSASATAVYGVQQVNFYAGNTLLAAVQNPPYQFTWTNPPPGDYALSASAVDNQQAVTLAPPARVQVLPAAPHLQIQPADAADMAVTWPVPLDVFYVESATNVDGPWTLSPYPPSFFTTGQTATIPAASCRQFFRLMSPQ